MGGHNWEQASLQSVDEIADTTSTVAAQGYNRYSPAGIYPPPAGNVRFYLQYLL